MPSVNAKRFLRLFVIDTGNGLGAFASSKGVVGQARSNMEAAGVDPKQIDIVLISHFHGDHIGGLKNADGSPSFPNAEIKVPATEAAFWADDANQSKANGFNKAQFANVKTMMAGLKVTPYEADKEIAPGITTSWGLKARAGGGLTLAAKCWQPAGSSTQRHPATSTSFQPPTSSY